MRPHFVQHFYCPDQQMHNICCAFIGQDCTRCTVRTSKYTFLLFSFLILLSICLPFHLALWQTYSFKVTSILYKRRYSLTPMRRITLKRTREHITDTFQQLKVVCMAPEVPVVLCTEMTGSWDKKPCSLADRDLHLEEMCFQTSHLP